MVNDNRDKIIKALGNPYLVSLLITIVIIWSLPIIFNKYKIDLIKREIVASTRHIYYADLNNDRISEKIDFSQFQNNFFSLTIFERDKVIDQWNFNGKFISTLKPITAKIEGNGFASICFILVKSNKIYLNVLNPFKNKFIAKDKFITDYIPIDKESNCSFYPQIFFDSNEDGIKEFYFTIEGNYSKQPRKVFKYDSVKDTIYMSAESYAAMGEFMIADTTNNRLNLISASSAVGNSDITDPYSDMFAWLMRFDSELTLKYEPIKIGVYPSTSEITSFTSNKKKYFVCLNIYEGIEKHPCTLKLFDESFRIIREKEFQFSNEWRGANLYLNNELHDCFFIIKTNGQAEVVDTNLAIVSRTTIPHVANNFISLDDIDGDSDNEVIFSSKVYDKIIIARSDLSDCVTSNCGAIRNISLKLNGNFPPELNVISGEDELTYSYQFNYLYYLKYPIYAGIYLIALLLIILIEKIQKHRAELKYETERKIAELQMKAIKNQIDPHFTLNIINSIGSLSYKEDREKADYVFGKYSKLLRMTVLNSDKIITTLANELEYVENYLELEMFRNHNKFFWEIKLPEDTELKFKIPKMLIHTFVENAIKHGLIHLEGNGKLLISINNNSKQYQINIRDNGIGRKEAKKIEFENTGRGLNILAQILDLYYELTKIRITYNIADLLDENENPLGTEVTIEIPKIND